MKQHNTDIVTHQHGYIVFARGEHRRPVKVTRAECEKLIHEKLVEIRAIAEQYAERPVEALSLRIARGESGCNLEWFNNRCWVGGEDSDIPIDAWYCGGEKRD